MLRAPIILCVLVLAATLFCPDLGAQALTTTFQADNGGSAGWGNLFDLKVTSPGGVSIHTLDVHCREAAKPLVLSVYITPGSYLGSEDRPARWSLVGGGKAVSRAKGERTRVDVSDIFLAPGSYGVAIYYGGAGMAYSNGTAANRYFANADLELRLGIAKSQVFGGATFTPRIWNGTLFYVKSNFAGFTPFGWGCRGTGGVPGLAGKAGSLPRIGTVFRLEVERLPAKAGVGVVQVGLSQAGYPGVGLPWELTLVGMPGCTLFTRLDFGLPLAHAGGSGGIDMALPLEPGLLGMLFYCQALIHDPTANALGFTLSNAGMGRVGL